MDRLELGQEISQMNLERLIVPENKKVLKDIQFEQQNIVVLDYSPKYKPNIHESTLT